MDQHKKDQGHQPRPDRGQQHQQQGTNRRDPAEGSRDHVNTGGERNRSDEGDGQGGISNRGMGRSGEQQDLPERGTNRRSDR